MTQNHISVMLNACIEGLNIKPNGIYIDGTFGRGGHSQLILEKLGLDGRLIAVDKDMQAVEYAHENFNQDKRFSIYHQGLEALPDLIQKLNLTGKIDGVLLDLGVSSPQLDDPSRGFSFKQDGPLDMRMDTTQGLSAKEWLAKAKAEEIAQVLRDLGEERFAKRIAGAIVRAREEKEIATTAELAEIVRKANPKWEKHKDPATRSFQAIRIFINQELSELEHLLSQITSMLNKNGRLVVLSFHSLEDRIIKRFLKRQSQGEPLPRGLPVKEEMLNKTMKVIGKAIKPSQEEVKNNVRARSAVLRIGEKIV